MRLHFAWSRFGTGVDMWLAMPASSDLIGKASGGRKLVVVFTDIVGYSRLIELDDMGPLERLNASLAKRYFPHDTTLICTIRPALAVLPFDNLRGDAAEEYFVDGLTEDITTTLAYWRWFPVIARNLTSSYRGRPKHAAQIGRELGATNLVEVAPQRQSSPNYRSAHRC